MKKIYARELTMESFKVYGTFSAMINPQAAKLGAGITEFYRDMELLNLGKTTIASFSVTHVNKRPNIVAAVEYHSFTGEGFLPLDSDVLIHVGPATRNGDVPLDRLEAFYVPKGTLVILRPGVWHGAPFAYESDEANILVVLPERTYANDCFVQRLAEEEKVEIVRA